MFRKRDADKVGWFNTKLHRVTDREYFMRLLTLGDCYIIPEVLSYIRAHAGTQTAQAKRKKHASILEWYKFTVAVIMASTPETDLSHLGIEKIRKWQASGCVSVMYRLLPKLHKKEYRKQFLEAYQIGYAEGALLMPFKYYLQRKLTGKRFKKQEIARQFTV
jgi:hypothetical protein